jgi:hypothetical protein
MPSAALSHCDPARGGRILSSTTVLLQISGTDTWGPGGRSEFILSTNRIAVTIAGYLPWTDRAAVSRLMEASETTQCPLDQPLSSVAQGSREPDT